MRRKTTTTKNVKLLPEQFYLRQQLLASLISLQFVDVLHEDAFVLEHISLSSEVQAVVPEQEKDEDRISADISLSDKY